MYSITAFNTHRESCSWLIRLCAKKTFVSEAVCLCACVCLCVFVCVCVCGIRCAGAGSVEVLQAGSSGFLLLVPLQELWHLPQRQTQKKKEKKVNILLMKATQL